jgi:hypothetical protein
LFVVSSGLQVAEFSLPGHLFSLDETADLTVVFHELGAISIGTDLKERWRIDTEILTEFELNDGRLLLIDMEGHRRTVDLASGALIINPPSPLR